MALVAGSVRRLFYFVPERPDRTVRTMTLFLGRPRAPAFRDLAFFTTAWARRQALAGQEAVGGFRPG